MTPRPKMHWPGSAHSTDPVPVVRSLQVGLHVLFVLLLLVGAVRAAGDSPGAALLGAAAVFVWYTFGIWFARRHTAKWLGPAWIVVLVIGWFGLIVLSSDFAWVAFALFFLSFHLLRPIWALTTTAVVTAGAIIALLDWGPSGGWPVVIGPVFGAAVAVGMSFIYSQLVADAAERGRLIADLRSAQQELLEAQDELGVLQREMGAVDERTRLAQEIHDTVTQGLASIMMLARAGNAGNDDETGDGGNFDRIERLAGDNLAEARRVVHALSPAELDEAPLSAALSRQVDQLRDQTGLEADLVIDGAVRRLPMALNVALLRVAQSALANVKQHAAAERVRLSLTYQPDEVTLDIVDDGRGFDSAALPARTPSGGYGLRAMRERIHGLSGSLIIESEPGDGTAVAVRLPVGDDRTADGPTGEI